MSRFTTSTFVGALIGAGAYVGYGILFDLIVMPALVQPGAASLSYGQLWFMVSMPLAALLGAGVGASIAFMRRWNGLVAGLLTVPVPLFVGFATTSLWDSSIRRYGSDPSDGILYTPLLVGSGICIAGNVAIAVIGFRRLFVVRNGKRSGVSPDTDSDGR